MPKILQRMTTPAWLLAAAGILVAVPQAVVAKESAPIPVKTEKCVTLSETKIMGPICKAFIRNDCTHPVDLKIIFNLTLRRLVVLPIIAEGNSTEYQDAGTAEVEQARRLEAGEADWFINKSEGKGIEVAHCKVGFSYKYLKK